jgi:hypothetical protein
MTMTTETMTTNLHLINNLAAELAEIHLDGMKCDGLTAKPSDADYWCAGGLRDQLEVAGVPEGEIDEEMVEMLRDSLRKAIKTAVKAADEAADEESLTLAINYLDADQHERGWVYRDDATRKMYIATERELIQLGRMIEARTPDAFSVWCSETTGEEFVEETDEDETED